jgi:hypothetical protein
LSGGASGSGAPFALGRPIVAAGTEMEPVRCRACSRATLGRSVSNQDSYCANVRAKGSVMATLISILITFLVVILVLYLVNMLPIDGRAKHIVRIIVIVIGILSLLKYLGVWF